MILKNAHLTIPRFTDWPECRKSSSFVQTRLLCRLHRRPTTIKQWRFLNQQNGKWSQSIRDESQPFKDLLKTTMTATVQEWQKVSLSILNSWCCNVINISYLNKLDTSSKLVCRHEVIFSEEWTLYVAIFTLACWGSDDTFLQIKVNWLHSNFLNHQNQIWSHCLIF